MSTIWIDGKPHIATDREVGKSFGIMRPHRFGCDLCGREFVVGDAYRWVYMNGLSPSPGNFMVCSECDCPDLATRIRDALSRHKPHMQDWVLLYQLEMNGIKPLDRTLREE